MVTASWREISGFARKDGKDFSSRGSLTEKTVQMRTCRGTKNSPSAFGKSIRSCFGAVQEALAWGKDSRACVEQSWQASRMTPFFQTGDQAAELLKKQKTRSPLAILCLLRDFKVWKYRRGSAGPSD